MFGGIVMKKTVKYVFRSFLFIIASICAIYFICYLLGPPPLKSDYTTVLYDKNENKLETSFMGNKKVELEHISPDIIDATVLIEDKYFYTHHGFDFRGIVRAMIENIKSGRLKEGASTITQQLARNLYLSHEKTWKRKIKEAFYTIRLELFYSKEEILTNYLNTIYYGHGAYGIADASEFFFNKRADELSLAEATMLVGIPKGPSYYSPFNDEENALTRQQLILTTLRNEKKITEAQYYEALAEPLIFHDPQMDMHSATHFQQVVFQEASDLLHLDNEAIMNGGYHIYTTIDVPLQKELKQIIENEIDATSEIEIGALTIDPDNGAVRSLIGSNPYHNSPFNRVTDAKRMVGSAFKPFLYYAALQHGYTPTTMLQSEPTTFDIDVHDVYKPKNFNNYYAYKPITLAEALAVSDNIYAVKTNLFLKPMTVIDATRKFGITSHLPNVPSLALGSASIPVDEMVNAYGIIANGGHLINRYTIEKITDKHGKTVYKHRKKRRKQVLNESKTFLLTHLMTGMFDERLSQNMHVTGASIQNKLSRVYAGKSGSTESDSWMIGFSPNLATGIWVGYDDNRPITLENDYTIAKNVWASFMEFAHEHRESRSFKVPDNITWKMIDPETGLIATEDCPTSKLMYFEKGTEPNITCHNHVNHVEVFEDTSMEKETWIKRFFHLFQ